MAFARLRELFVVPALLFGLRMAGCAAGSEKASNDITPEDSGSSAVPTLSTADAATSDAAPTNERCSTDGWCRVDIPNDKAALFGVWGSAPNDVWVVGSNGAVLHWNGATWNEQRFLTDAGQPKPIFGIWGSGPHDVWAFTANEILHSDGWNETETTWSILGTPKPDNFNAASVRGVWGSSATDVWMVMGPPNASAAGLLHKCWHSDGWNGPTTRLTTALDLYIAPLTGMNFNAVWGTGANDVWVVGETGRILHTDGYWGDMAEWTQTNSNTRSHLTSVWGTAPDDVWAVGENGTIRHWTYNEGDELGWAISDSTTVSHLRAVWGTSAANLFAIGDDSTILHGDGANWTREAAPSLPPSTTLYGVWGSGPDDVWAVGERVVLHRSGGAGAAK